MVAVVGAGGGQAHGGRGRGAEGLGNFGRELSPSCDLCCAVLCCGRSPREEFSGGERSGVWLSRPDSPPFCAAFPSLPSDPL